MVERNEANGEPFPRNWRYLKGRYGRGTDCIRGIRCEYCGWSYRHPPGQPGGFALASKLRGLWNVHSKTCNKLERRNDGEK